MRSLALSAVAICAIGAGCGKTIQARGTEQLLASAAIDTSIAKIDFRALAGEKVFLDTQFIKPLKESIGIVNSEYAISALRQQMMAANCLLQEKAEEADYIVEARLGALGNNQHEVVYGIPANNALSAVTTIMPNMPPVPTIPEISLARRDHNTATAKVALFAYHRETRQPVWQSGTSIAHSNARDIWLFGAGPIQVGSIYPETRLAGNRLGMPFKKTEPVPNPNGIAFDQLHSFSKVESPVPAPPAETENIATQPSKQPAALPLDPPPPPPPPPTVQPAKHDKDASVSSGVSPVNTTREEFEEAMRRQVGPTPEP